MWPLLCAFPLSDAKLQMHPAKTHSQTPGKGWGGRGRREQVDNFGGDPMAASLAPSPPSVWCRVEVRGYLWHVRALPCRVRPARCSARLCPFACGEERGAQGQAGQGGGFGGRGCGCGLRCRCPGAGPENRGGSWPGAVPRCWLCPVPTALLRRCPQPVPRLRRVRRETALSSSGTSWGPVPCWPLPSGISAQHDMGPRECPVVGQGHVMVRTPVPTCSLVPLPGTPVG